MLQPAAPNPTWGAAYLVIVERVNPDACSTRERQSEILKVFEQIREWANKQAPEIAEAYNWSMEYIEKGIEGRLRQYEASVQIPGIKETLPKPPPEFTLG